MLKVQRPRFVKPAKGRNGETYLYFRREGFPAVRLHSPDGSWDLVWEAFARFIETEMAGKAAPSDQSFLTYIKDYENSAEFGRLTPKVQTKYRAWLKAFRADLGELHAGDIDATFIIRLRDTWAKRGYEAANTGLKVLKPIIDRARIAGAITDDPMSLVAKVQRPHAMGEAHPAWNDAEVEAALEWCMAAGDSGRMRAPGLARAIALGRYGGFRRQSICSIPRSARQMVPGSDGMLGRRLIWITEKRKVLADKPEDPRLTDVLRRTPDLALKIAYNADGNPWKERQLNQAITRLMVRLAKQGRARSITLDDGSTGTPLDIHGLRHARGVELAESGCTEAEIMAQIDHATTRAAAIYRRQAERRKFADAAQHKLDNVVTLRRRRASGEA